eukprot:SAG11_NODE_9701_length_888_cov_1.082383_1_plen_63_part_10
MLEAAMGVGRATVAATAPPEAVGAMADRRMAVVGTVVRLTATAARPARRPVATEGAPLPTVL